MDNETDDIKSMQILNLFEEKTALENRLRILENKLNDKETLLGYFTEKQASTLKPIKRISDKTKFFNDHKNDDDIQQQLQPFKEAYPNIKIPNALIRSLTDAKYKSSLNN
jgi:hypothetical protein